MQANIAPPPAVGQAQVRSSWAPLSDMARQSRNFARLRAGPAFCKARGRWVARTLETVSQRHAQHHALEPTLASKHNCVVRHGPHGLTCTLWPALGQLWHAYRWHCNVRSFVAIASALPICAAASLPSGRQALFLDRRCGLACDRKSGESGVGISSARPRNAPEGRCRGQLSRVRKAVPARVSVMQMLSVHESAAATPSSLETHGGASARLCKWRDKNGVGTDFRHEAHGILLCAETNGYACPTSTG